MPANADNQAGGDKRSYPLLWRLGYGTLRTIVRVLLAVYCRARYEGRDNVPATGPLIVAGNHSGWLDALILGAAIARPVHYIIAREYYEKWYFKWLLVLFGAIPVERGKGAREPVRRALNVLRQGGVVGMFPEGRMSLDGKLKRFEGGIALIARDSGAPILPLAIEGGFEIMGPAHSLPRPRKLRVRIGKPFETRGLERDEILGRLETVLRRLGVA